MCEKELLLLFHENIYYLPGILTTGITLLLSKICVQLKYLLGDQRRVKDLPLPTCRQSPTSIDLNQCRKGKSRSAKKCNNSTDQELCVWWFVLVKATLKTSSSRGLCMLVW